ARFPDNSDARQELRDVYREKGQLGKAVEHALALAEIARLKGDAKSASRYEDEARELVPAVSAAPPQAPSKPAAPAPSPVVRDPDDEEITIAQNDEEVLLEV